MKFSKYISQQILFSSADNGDGEIRTLDPLLARQVLSQLSYAPIWVTYLIIQSHSASGLEKTRTSDLHVPNVARCQLCYTPIGDRKGNENFYIATTFFIKNLK